MLLLRSVLKPGSHLLKSFNDILLHKTRTGLESCGESELTGGQGSISVVIRYQTKITCLNVSGSWLDTRPRLQHGFLEEVQLGIACFSRMSCGSFKGRGLSIPSFFVVKVVTKHGKQNPARQFEAGLLDFFLEMIYVLDWPITWFILFMTDITTNEVFPSSYPLPDTSNSI